MNPPQVYMCSPSWTLLSPPSPYHPSGSSQCTSPKHPVLCIEPGLATRFIHDILHVSMPFYQIFPPSLSHRKTPIQYTNIYMEFRKMVTITLCTRLQKRHWCIEQSYGLSFIFKFASQLSCYCIGNRGLERPGVLHWKNISIGIYEAWKQGLITHLIGNWSGWNAFHF